MAEKRRTDEIQGEIIHEYDGIEEADNQLPRWWLATFYGAILFAIGYWFYYHEYSMGPTTPEVFAAEMAERAAGAQIDDTILATLAEDASTVADGREAFSTTCAACHGAEGQGVIGPNLTDDRWLHGGSALEIYTSIRGGISPERARIPGSAGMPEWGAQLGERRVRAVAAYLLSIRGTNVSGREPEGDPYDPDAAPAEGTPEAVPEAVPAPAEAPTEAPGGTTPSPEVTVAPAGV